jgi:hypothetical protein
MSRANLATELNIDEYFLRTAGGQDPIGFGGGGCESLFIGA